MYVCDAVQILSNPPEEAAQGAQEGGNVPPTGGNAAAIAQGDHGEQGGGQPLTE